jgi:hypothetical protein
MKRRALIAGLVLALSAGAAAGNSTAASGSFPPPGDKGPTWITDRLLLERCGLQSG